MITDHSMLFSFLLLVVVFGVTTAQDTDKEAFLPSDKNSIKLPKAGKILVFSDQKKNWTAAQSTCEKAGGTLYQMPSARLYSRPSLMECLSSSSRDGKDYSDLWFDGVSLWSPHFMWTNHSLVNKVSFCPDQKPQTSDAPITSDFLSVEYCVSICHDQGATYTVLYSLRTTPMCNCIFNLGTSYQVPCGVSRFDPSDSSRYFIIHTKEDSLIKVGSADTFSSTEIMCATVDDKTVTDREMKSDTCFSQRPFLCELGTTDACKGSQDSLNCLGKECLFTSGDKCLKRVSTPDNWYAARSYCNGLGGDLWKLVDLDDMTQVTQFLDGQSRYWIGASNYGWDFNASAKHTSGINTQPEKLRCGHIFSETNTGSQRWSWSDADCSQEKTFLCQFEYDKFTSSEKNQNVSCPWPITTYAAGTGGSGDHFPLAAVIAGIIAGVILLTCLALSLAFCGRRHWKKVRERLAFIPYFSDNSHVVLGNSHEFETMSQAGHNRSHMSSVSEHGSQTGLVKGGYPSYGMNSSGYGDSNGMYSSKSLDRRHMGTMGQKLADSQHYLVSHNNSMDERGFTASYSTMPSKHKEYMTLQGQMNIQDEAQLQAMRGSLRHKPEMTLVTNNVDMNLTVNHASGSHHGGSGSGSVTERVMEEVTLPGSDGGVILTFPDRVQEAHHYTSSTIQRHT